MAIVGARRALLSAGVAWLPTLGSTRAVVHIDFVGGRYYAQGGQRRIGDVLTLTRGSSKTAQTLAGDIVTFGTGQPAITDQGILIEEQRTQLLAYPSAPQVETITLTTGQHAISCYGTGSYTVAAGTATITGAGAATQAAPLVFNVTTAGTVTLTPTGSLTRVQLEKGGFATSHIATGGAIRYADAAQLSNSILALINADAATLVTRVRGIRNTAHASRIVQASASIPLYIYTGTGFAMVDSDAALFRSATVTAPNAIAQTWDAAGRALCINGGAVGSSAVQHVRTNTFAWLGSDNGNYSVLNGYVQSLTIYPRRATDAELRGASA